MLNKALVAIAFLPLAACAEENLTPPTVADYESGELEPLACMPNLDGIIEGKELTPAFDVGVSYLVSHPDSQRPVDVAGTLTSDGKRRWDWAYRAADDRAARISASQLEGKWYAGSFPGGGFVAPGDAGGMVESIYSHDDRALWLHGVASAEQAPKEGQTLLVYNAPVELYRFPLEVGREWVSTGVIENGVLRGLPNSGRHIYEVVVDASGELLLPDLTFSQVLRVRTKVSFQMSVGDNVSQQQVSFFFECFGEVARATSLPNETRQDFELASEVRRLGLL